MRTRGRPIGDCVTDTNEAPLASGWWRCGCFLKCGCAGGHEIRKIHPPLDETCDTCHVAKPEAGDTAYAKDAKCPWCSRRLKEGTCRNQNCSRFAAD